MKIPAPMTVVNMTTGQVIEERTVEWTLLPPPEGACSICAHNHKPDEPHNAQSLYYQTVFNAKRGRPATWADAIAHCPAETQAKWKQVLQQMGKWTEPESLDK